MHADRLRESGKFSDVRCAFLKEEPLIENCLAGWENEQVDIIPDFLAEGYFTRQVIPELLKLETRSENIHYCPPVGTHPLMADLIKDAVNDVVGDWDPAQTSLLVVGHGSGKNPCSKQTLLSHLDVIRQTSSFVQVADLWLEEAPLVSSWSEVATQQNVIILPFLLNDGQHGGWDIPAVLGVSHDVDVHGPIHQIDGKKIRVSRALGTSPRFTEAIDALAEVWGQ